MGNSIPKKLSKSPLVASSAELRLSESVPTSILLSKLYPALATSYGELEMLGPANLPEEMVKQNPNMAFLPHYRVKGLNGANFGVQFGPRALVFSSRSPDYDIDFNGPFNAFLSILETLNLLSKIQRIGLRYINLFEGANKLDSMSLDIQLGNKPVSDCLSNLRLQISSGEFTVGIVMASEAMVNMSDDNVGGVFFGTPPVEVEQRKGAVLDIDVSTTEIKTGDAVVTASSLTDKFHAAHKIARTTFFDALKEEAIQSLQPEY
jgi:uncharacterized protein (TIGR04255 family)